MMSAARGETRAPLEVGDIAPEFALAGSDGRTYRLSDYRGRSAVVIAWFPKAFTPGCAAECRSIAAQQPALGAFAAQTFAISVDRPETNAKFAASIGPGVVILSDPMRTAARAYGVLGVAGFARRWTFIIGKDGRVLAVDKHVSANTHGRDLAERLQSLGVEQQT